MFLCYISSKLCLSANATVLDLCSITELRKKTVKNEIFLNLKEFRKSFFILYFFYNNLS